MPSTSAFPLNGINATTGEYLPCPDDLETLYAAITKDAAVAQVLKSDHYANLKEREERAVAQPFGLAFGIDPKKLEETGWGVIFAYDAPDELYEALQPLLQWRRAQAGKKRRSSIGSLAVRSPATLVTAQTIPRPLFSSGWGEQLGSRLTHGGGSLIIF